MSSGILHSVTFIVSNFFKLYSQHKYSQPYSCDGIQVSKFQSLNPDSNKNEPERETLDVNLKASCNFTRCLWYQN